MKVLVSDAPREVALRAADLVARTLAGNPALVLALPTGATALPLYRELERRHRRGQLHLGRARAFNLDELVLPPDHPATFRAFMEQHAWERIGLERRRCDIPDTTADLGAECRRYDAALAAAGGLDLAILGLGVDGHVAYNLPGQVAEGTHVVTLPDLVADRLNPRPESRPLRALTLGMGALRAARRVLLMATGTTKRAAVQALLNGPNDPLWPASLLCDHPELHVLLDRDAAG